MLEMIKSGYADTSGLLAELAEHPEVWDTYRFRTAPVHSPHRDMSDVWVRYNPIENFDGDIQKFNAPHVSQWYPVVETLPDARRLSERISKDYDATIGGVLITRLPAGKKCHPHVDHGWHAGYYEKFALQLMGNKDQKFIVGENELVTLSGDLFRFDNSVVHSVRNDSDEDRITMIVCLRRH